MQAYGAAAQQKDSKFYTLSELVKDTENQELYVLNTSKPKGNIAFVVSDGLGGKMSVLITATWIPIDLTTKATRDVLVKSPEFRRLHAGGFLAFPRPEYVAQLMSKEGAQQESARVYNASVDPELNNGVVNQEAQAVLEGDNVSGFILNLCNAEDLEEGEALNSARQQEADMTPEDLKYLMDNCKFPKVKAFAATALTERNNA